MTLKYLDPFLNSFKGKFFVCLFTKQTHLILKFQSECEGTFFYTQIRKIYFTNYNLKVMGQGAMFNHVIIILRQQTCRKIP